MEFSGRVAALSLQRRLGSFGGGVLRTPAHLPTHMLSRTVMARRPSPSDLALEALSRFENVKRRMEVRGVVNGITVYDDFAHHPTAITTTIAGLRKKVGTARILAVLEPRSNTMKLGSMKAALPDSLSEADLVFAYGATSGKDALGWDLAQSLAPLGKRASSFHELTELQEAIVAAAQPGDHILMMSNGGFGGIHQKVVNRLTEMAA